MKLDNPYSRLAYSRNQLRDLLTKEKSTIDFLLANISGIDNKKMMVFRNKNPYYHQSHECSKLFKELVNFEVPEKIRIGGTSSCDHFKLWVAHNWSAKININQFSENLYNEFGVKWTDLNSFNNSACITLNNIKLDNLEEIIINV